MGKFRKKPVVIEATQWDGTFSDKQRIEKENPTLVESACQWHEGRNEVSLWMIKTLEGNHIVSRNDWIIKGIKGEFYPCKPDIFEATYELVDTKKAFLNNKLATNSLK